LEGGENMTLKDIMSTEVMTVGENKSCSDAAQLMRDKHVGCLPVMDSDRLIGIITDRDIVTRVIANNLDPNEQRVSDFMSKTLVTANPNMSAEEASRLMADKAIRRLPILENERLAGIVSLGDLARAEEKTLAGETLSKISRPTVEERMVA
jgi:CBS domain-containing protein